MAALPDRAWIEAHVPHQGSMCLLDGVESWDAEHIRCTSHSHHRADNPLRADGRLSALNGIEYAAQAMAVHGALLAGADAAPSAGFLGSARGVECLVERLDDIPGALTIRAERLSADERTLLYAFTLSTVTPDDASPDASTPSFFKAGEQLLVRGRAAVVLIDTLPTPD